MQKRVRGHQVPPLSRKKIKRAAEVVRETLLLGANKINMSHFIEFILPSFMPEFSFEVLELAEMGIDEARTYPDKGLMQIRADVYQKLSEDDGRAQFTIAHELGHLVLHSGIGKFQRYARNQTVASHAIYADSEWQADSFASEFLMPETGVLGCSCVEEVQEKYGVSYRAAEVRFNKLKGY